MHNTATRKDGMDDDAAERQPLLAPDCECNTGQHIPIRNLYYPRAVRYLTLAVMTISAVTVLGVFIPAVVLSEKIQASDYAGFWVGLVTVLTTSFFSQVNSHLVNTMQLCVAFAVGLLHINAPVPSLLSVLFDVGLLWLGFWAYVALVLHSWGPGNGCYGKPDIEESKCQRIVAALNILVNVSVVLTCAVGLAQLALLLTTLISWCKRIVFPGVCALAGQLRMLISALFHRREGGGQEQQQQQPTSTEATNTN